MAAGAINIMCHHDAGLKIATPRGGRRSAIVRPPHGPVVPLIHRPALRSDVNRAKHRKFTFLSHKISNNNFVPVELFCNFFL